MTKPCGRSEGERAALLGRLRFYYTNRHNEPLARLRARSILAQLRPRPTGRR